MSTNFLVYGSLISGGLTVFIAMLKSHHFFKSLFLNLFQGIGALLAVSLSGLLTGVVMPINWFTLCFSAIGGTPAVILLLIFKTFFS